MSKGTPAYSESCSLKTRSLPGTIQSTGDVGYFLSDLSELDDGANLFGFQERGNT